MENIKFTRLTIHSEPIRKGRYIYFKCVCDCGIEKTVEKNALVTGRTKSCGCLNKELTSKRFTKTDGFSTKYPGEFGSYRAMLTRCYNEKHPTYKNYGARGITVCDRWNPSAGGSFQNFMEDMGVRPKRMSLERNEVNCNYSPENCCWDTTSRQAFNKRLNTKNPTGRVGVYKGRREGSFTAMIWLEYKIIRLGTYNSFDEAVKAREQAELKYFGFIKNLI